MPGQTPALGPKAAGGKFRLLSVLPSPSHFLAFLPQGRPPIRRRPNRPERHPVTVSSSSSFTTPLIRPFHSFRPSIRSLTQTNPLVVRRSGDQLLTTDPSLIDCWQINRSPRLSVHHEARGGRKNTSRPYHRRRLSSISRRGQAKPQLSLRCRCDLGCGVDDVYGPSPRS